MRDVEVERGRDIEAGEMARKGKLCITPPDRDVEERIRRTWDGIAKPLDGFGAFEKITARIGAIQGDPAVDLHHAEVLVLCADNGIVREGVSQSGQEVTAICAGNIAAGRSSLGPLAEHAGIPIRVVDIGMAGRRGVIPGVLDARIADGTEDFLEKPAMTKKEAAAAIGAGIRMVREEKERGITLLCTGEMGIGNTTTSAAILSALLSLPPKKTCGRGAGLTDAGLARKTKVVGEALQKYERDLADPFLILCDMGGLDIAGLAGVFIGGAVYHVPVIADGVISQTAALVADRLLPGVRDFVIPSHRSREPGGEALVQGLFGAPVLDAGLAVGEGTGAVLMLILLQAVIRVYHEAATFKDYELKPYERSGDHPQ